MAEGGREPDEMGVPRSADPSWSAAGVGGTGWSAPELRHAPLSHAPHVPAELGQVLARIGRGTRLEEILDFVYESFRGDIPFDRISLATLDADSGRLVARWVRSDGKLEISSGYAMDLAQTGLQKVFDSGRPRIIGDLRAYLQERPDSEGTRRLVTEGLRSSLTCPLVVDGRRTGFLFFNSRLPAAYHESHVGIFEQLAATIALLFEHGRLFDELAEQKALIERQSRELAAENRRHNEEIALARVVQRALIHGELPADHMLRAEMLYEPATSIGGDMVECIALDRHTGLFFVADAVGHGVPAALIMSVVRTALHNALTQHDGAGRPRPAALLAAVNQTLLELFDLRYVTAVFALIDARAHTATLSLAGHPPALLLRRESGRIEAVDARHVPLGVSAATQFADVEVPFAPGDVLVLYTDGVLEAEDPREVAFDQEGLRAALQAHPGGGTGRMSDRVRAALAEHCQGVPLLDDLAILTVDYKSTPSRRRG